MSSISKAQMATVQQADLITQILQQGPIAEGNLVDKSFEFDPTILAAGATQYANPTAIPGTRQFSPLASFIPQSSVIPTSAIPTSSGLIDTRLDLDADFLSLAEFSTDYYLGTLDQELELELGLFGEPAEVDAEVEDVKNDIEAIADGEDLYNGVVVDDVVSAEFVETSYHPIQPLEIVDDENLPRDTQVVNIVKDSIDANQIPEDVVVVEVEDAKRNPQPVVAFKKPAVEIAPQITKNDVQRTAAPRQYSPVPSSPARLALGAIVSIPAETAKVARANRNDFDRSFVSFDQSVAQGINPDPAGDKTSKAEVTDPDAKVNQEIKIQPNKTKNAEGSVDEVVLKTKIGDLEIQVADIDDGTEEFQPKEFSKNITTNRKNIFDGVSITSPSSEVAVSATQVQPGDANAIHAGQQAAVLGAPIQRGDKNLVTDQKDTDQVIDDANKKLDTVADKGSRDHADGQQEGDKGLDFVDADKINDDLEGELNSDEALENLLAQFADQVSKTDVAIS